MLNYTSAFEASDTLIHNMFTNTESFLNFLATPSLTKTQAEEVLENIVAMQSRAEVFFWSKALLEVVLECSTSLPQDTKLELSDFPTLEGFFYFEAPVKFIIQNSLAIALHGITWAIVLNKDVIVVLWNSALERPYLTTAAPVLFGNAEGSTTLSLDSIRVGPKFNVVPLAQWPLFASMLLFMKQKLVTHTEQHPDRAARRRTKTKLNPLHVVYLRKYDYTPSHHDSKHIDHEYRWMVRGHWRNQYYRSINANKPLWINPYIKGPEDKQLKPKQNLFAVVR